MSKHIAKYDVGTCILERKWLLQNQVCEVLEPTCYGALNRQALTSCCICYFGACETNVGGPSALFESINFPSVHQLSNEKKTNLPSLIFIPDKIKRSVAEFE